MNQPVAVTRTPHASTLTRSVFHGYRPVQTDPLRNSEDHIGPNPMSAIFLLLPGILSRRHLAYFPMSEPLRPAAYTFH